MSRTAVFWIDIANGVNRLRLTPFVFVIEALRQSGFMMEDMMTARVMKFGLVVSLLLLSNLAASPTAFGQSAQIIKEIRHELVTLPYYGVFDWLEYEVGSDNSVVLRGSVVRPSTKSDAEKRVKEIDGVQRVVNEIDVLPASPMDDRLRVRLYRAIYGFDSPLFRYSHQAVPSIHIIVKGGRATLKGIVDSKGDATQAYVRARGVPGLFEVKNELVVGSDRPR